MRVRTKLVDCFRASALVGKPFNSAARRFFVHCVAKVSQLFMPGVLESFPERLR